MSIIMIKPTKPEVRAPSLRHGFMGHSSIGDGMTELEPKTWIHGSWVMKYKAKARLRKTLTWAIFLDKEYKGPTHE